jgi:hypothetical protein
MFDIIYSAPTLSIFQSGEELDQYLDHIQRGAPRAPLEHGGLFKPASAALLAGITALQRRAAAAINDLRATHSHKSRSAALLGLTLFQLYSRLKRHNIDVVPDEPARVAFERNLLLRVRFRTFTFKVARSVCARYHRRRASFFPRKPFGSTTNDATARASLNGTAIALGWRMERVGKGTL